MVTMKLEFDDRTMELLRRQAVQHGVTVEEWVVEFIHRLLGFPTTLGHTPANTTTPSRVPDA